MSTMDTVLAWLAIGGTVVVALIVAWVIGALLIEAARGLARWTCATARWLQGALARMTYDSNATHWIAAGTVIAEPVGRDYGEWYLAPEELALLRRAALLYDR